MVISLHAGSYVADHVAREITEFRKRQFTRVRQGRLESRWDTEIEKYFDMWSSSSLPPTHCAGSGRPAEPGNDPTSGDSHALWNSDN
jgi:hypothetical protein